MSRPMLGYRFKRHCRKQAYIRRRLLHRARTASTSTKDYLQMQKDLAAWLAACPDLKTATQDFLSQIVWMEHIDYSRLLLVNPDGSLTVIGEDGIKHARSLTRKIDRGSFLATIAMQNAPVYLDRDAIEKKQAHCTEANSDEEIRSAALIPLKYGGEAEALFCAISLSVDRLPETICDVLESVAGLMTTAIARFQSDEARRKSEERFQDVALASSDWIWEIDKDRKYTFATDKIKDLLGYSPEEIIGKTPFDLLPQNEAKRLAVIYDMVMSPPPREIRNLETWAHTLDGRSVCLQTNGRPILNDSGELVGYRGVDTDITKKKIAEQALKEAKEAAEKANEAKSQFLANMSHEIRTPMNGVIGILDLLTRTTLTQKQREYIEMARQSGSHLLELINEILDFSKLKSAKTELRREEFELQNLIESVATMFSERCAQKGVSLSVATADNVPSRVQGDQRRVRQILINLLGNAFKFTDSGSIFVGVSTEKREETSAVVVIRIIDSGIGIAADKLETLFDPFIQVDASSSRKHEGTGLGLAIVKELIELMSGSIQVTSSPGNGTSFTVRLPFEVLSTPAETATKSSIAAKRIVAQTTSGRDPRILVVEDNEVNKVVTVDMLLELGCTAETASNGKEALKVLESQESFDLVLMDCQMPEMDGYEAAREIRKDPAQKELPIVALTAHATTEDRDKALDAGMDDYLSKPITVKKLAQMIESFVFVPLETDNRRPRGREEEKSLSSLDSNEAALSTNIARSDKLISLFLSFMPQYLDQLESAVAAADPPAISAAAHKLKGSCLSFGAQRMAPICIRIESDGKNSDITEVKGLFSALKSEFERVKTSLTQYRNI